MHRKHVLLKTEKKIRRLLIALGSHRKNSPLRLRVKVINCSEINKYLKKKKSFELIILEFRFVVILDISPFHRGIILLWLDLLPCFWIIHTPCLAACDIVLSCQHFFFFYIGL